MKDVTYIIKNVYRTEEKKEREKKLAEIIKKQIDRSRKHEG